MPVTDHPDLPNAQDGLLWRYMTMAKYLDLLSRRALWLSRADCLGDPYEGHFTPATLQASQDYWDEHGLDPSLPVDEAGNASPEILRRMGHGASKMMYANCWHESEYESAALWAQYAADGIAVSTTVQRLRQALAGARQHLYVAKVTYLDFDHEGWDSSNLLSNVLHKRRSFEHEREVRLVTLHTAEDGLEAQPAGFYAEVDLDVLVERVHVAPSSPEWFRQAVVAATQQFGLDCEVVTSRLAERPVG